MTRAQPSVSYAAKRALVRALMIVTSPLALPARWSYRYLGLTGWFAFSGAVLSIIPGRPGQYLRASFYVQTLRRCAYDVSLGFLSMVTDPEAEFGRKVYAGSLCLIGRANVADNVLIASRVLLMPTARATASTAVCIGSGTWIGESAIVQANVGEGCVIGAGAVVLEPVAADTTVAGNPARILSAQ